MSDVNAHPAAVNRLILFKRLAAFVLFTFCASTASAKENNRQAQPLEPVAAILDIFRSYQIVALGEGNHNNEQSHRFRLSLIRNLRFTDTVNDIVVEFGNARYQDVMDRFVRGEEVPDHVLRQVWQNTTQHSAVLDVSIYEEFFRAVRAVNASLTKDRQLRVLLGDPPVDWNDSRPVETQERDFETRDVFAARLISREVVAKHRRALIIYGDGHFSRRPPDPRNSLVALLERAGTKVFTITTNTVADLEEIQPSVASWPEPSLTLIRGTVLEQADFVSVPYPSTTIQAGNDGFDALLYVGHPLTVTYARFAKELCRDVDYIRMRSKRVGDPKWESNFKKKCAAPPPVLPELWRTYRDKGLAATLAVAPTKNGDYEGGPTDLYRLAQSMLKRHKFDDAVAVLELNTKLFPRDVLSLDTLAQAYAGKGDVAASWTSSRRALAINPHDKAARHALGLDK